MTAVLGEGIRRGGCASRSPPGAFEAPPSLVTRPSLLSPGGAAPSGSLTVLPARLRAPLRHRLPSSLVPRSSVQAAPRPPARSPCFPLASGSLARGTAPARRAAGDSTAMSASLLTAPAAHPQEEQHDDDDQREVDDGHRRGLADEALLQVV